MILVAGSTGVLGSEIVRQLRAQNKPVKALVRKTSNPDKVAWLRSTGAEIVEGDLTDRASLDRACQDIDTVISTATTTASQNPEDTIPTVDQQGQLQLVDAALAAGVPQFIYISIPLFNIPCALETAKRTVEQRIMGSGVTYTILRPTYFIEGWLSPAIGFDYPNHQARIYGTGENPISWISFVDVARFAVMAVDHPSARNAILDLGGPESLSPNAVIRIFEQVSGKPFSVEYVPVEALQAQYESSEHPLQKTFLALMLAYANGNVIDMTGVLASFPGTLASVNDYAARVAVSTG